VALHYLADQGIQLDRNPTNPTELRLGSIVLPPLDANAGSYVGNDARGYQTLIHYRSAQRVARMVTLTEVLAGSVDPSWVKGKVVLVGMTAESIKDLFYTPHSTGQANNQKMPGVVVQAQVVSQILGSALDQKPWPWYWSDAWELGWIAVWGLGGGLVAVMVRSRWGLVVAGFLALLTVGGLSFGLFLQQGWVPVVPAILALVGSLAAVRGTLSLTSTVQTLADTVVMATPAVRVGERYTLERTLGAGGMGDVYLARDTLVGRQVAVKILKANIADQPGLRLRFEREVAVCAALESPNIVQVTDYGVTNQGYPFFVMEYLRGQTLGDLLKKEPQLTAQRAIAIVQQVCEGLRLAHQGVVLKGETTPCKLVHRDLKPDNIFLVPTPLGELIKVLDFGIVKLQTERVTQTGQFVGTSRYAAPEQWQGQADVDQRADIYSLGVIFYEMLSGTDPFGLGTEPTSLARWYVGHVLSPPKPLVAPPALAAVVMRCLAKKPAERFRNVDEL